MSLCVTSRAAVSGFPEWLRSHAFGFLAAMFSRLVGVLVYRESSHFTV